MLFRSRGDDRVGMVLEEFPRMIAGVREGVARIAKIVNGLKGYSRQGPMELKPFPIAEAVEGSLSLCRNLLKGRAEVNCRLPGDLPLVQGDVRQIEQVLTNLLTNAADALAGVPNARIDVEARAMGRRVVVAVTDNGPGLNPKTIAHVFDPFFTTKEDGKGTGLGLPISKGIVEAHGGTMDAWNVAEGGAQFSFALPVADERTKEMP